MIKFGKQPKLSTPGVCSDSLPGDGGLTSSFEQQQAAMVARVRKRGVMVPFILLGGHRRTLSSSAKSIKIYLVQVVYY